MVSSVADMESVFGPQEDPMRVKRITQMDNGNRWDFGFMFLYAMFMGLFSLAVYKKDGGVLWLGSAIIGLSAGVFDAIENVTLLKLTANFNSPSLLAMIWMPVYAKFIAISISSLAACFHIATQSTVAWKLIGIVAMLACIGTCLALISPAEYGWVIQHTVTLSWVPMLVFCAIHSFRDPLI